MLVAAGPLVTMATPGRPVTYATTDRFLEHFGLATLYDLPGVQEMKAAGLLDLHDVLAAQRRPDLVGRRAAVGLHVGGVGAEELLDAVDGQLLGDVDELAAAVVALARVALGVLVGELAALGLHDGRRGVVLAGDQLDVVFLAAVLVLDGRPELGVDQGESGGVAVKHGSVPKVRR